MPHYRVTRQQLGDRMYFPGETRELTAAEARPLVDAGSLEPAEKAEKPAPLNKAEPPAPLNKAVETPRTVTTADVPLKRGPGRPRKDETRHA